LMVMFSANDPDCERCNAIRRLIGNRQELSLDELFTASAANPSSMLGIPKALSQAMSDNKAIMNTTDEHGRHCLTIPMQDSERRKLIVSHLEAERQLRKAKVLLQKGEETLKLFTAMLNGEEIELKQTGYAKSMEKTVRALRKSVEEEIEVLESKVKFCEDMQRKCDDSFDKELAELKQLKGKSGEELSAWILEGVADTRRCMNQKVQASINKLHANFVDCQQQCLEVLDEAKGVSEQIRARIEQIRERMSCEDMVLNKVPDIEMPVSNAALILGACSNLNPWLVKPLIEMIRVAMEHGATLYEIEQTLANLADAKRAEAAEEKKQVAVQQA